MKIVINTCYGGFSLSPKASQRYKERTGKTIGAYPDIERNDPDLVSVMEELGEEANGPSASLKVVDVPDDVKWYIRDYDGKETVVEQSRCWS